jgi:hypothetical protein
MSYIAVAGIAVSVGTSFFSAGQASKQAEKQRELAWNMHLLDLAEQEKISMEQIRTTAETDRIKILSDSLEKYREALQKESTIRLRDTWIYVAGLGAGTGVLYGLFLMGSKSGGSNGSA